MNKVLSDEGLTQLIKEIKKSINTATGDLNTLETTDKENLVNAINELFIDVSNGKNLLETAITDKGVSVSKENEIATFNELSAAINNISQSGKSILPTWYTDDLWFPLATKPSTSISGSTVIINKKIYCYNEVYDTETNTWETISNNVNMISSPYYYNNLIYGILIGSAAFYIYTYDPLTQTNTRINSKSFGTKEAHYNPKCVGLGSNIYLIGGYYIKSSNKYNKANIDCYDILTDTWTSKTDMPKGQSVYICNNVNDEIYCIYGHYYSSSTASSTTKLENKYKYDPVSDTWETLYTSSSFGGLSYESSFVADEKIYSIASLTYSTNYGKGELVCFDTTTDTCEEVSINQSIIPLINGIYRHIKGYAACVDGIIYILGGSMRKDDETTSTATDKCVAYISSVI